MTFKKIAIVGCGLIGGSLAKKIHQEKPEVTIIGLSSKAELLQKDPRSNCFSKLIKQTSELDQDCDLVIVSVPIEHTVSSIVDISKRVGEHCIMTDVASIKESIQVQLSKESIKQPVILGHPMAGKENTGFTVSEASLFEGAPYFLINDGSDAFKRLSEFLKSLGMFVIETTAKEHDIAVSLSSHLPYLMASATVSSLSSQSEAIQQLVKESYGPGFRDTTRVAGSDPKWGRAVCEDNAENLSKHLSLVIDALQSMKTKIDEQSFDDIEASLRQTKHLKDSLKRQ